MIRRYFYQKLKSYIHLFVRDNDSAVLLCPEGEDWSDPALMRSTLEQCRQQQDNPPDYIVIQGMVHYERDIQSFLNQVHTCCAPSTRLIITYYSSLWRPFLLFATALGLRRRTPEQNWVSHEDMENFLLLTDFEPVRLEGKVLCPLWIPLLSDFLNRFIAPLPFFRSLTMVNILVARPRAEVATGPAPSVSVVVAARNEAGNIEGIIRRLPRMGPDDELIFVEGHSKDNTWETIQAAAEKYGATHRILIAQQDGKGKGDAVRKGFGMATKDILMILDADMTVPPEDLPKFYQAITSGKGEFINGSRLVYPMEGEAMRFLNMVANKFFALAFSFVVGQRFKDTLCGTKVLTRENYKKLASHRSYFGNFDPFGDFDLIFGSARMGLKIVEVPISYKNRTYGSTNISRWSHGAILLRMLVFAASRLRFI